jgi:hypothetical protein
MRAWFWFVLAVLGFLLMSAAFYGRVQVNPHAPWAHGLIAIGPDRSGEMHAPAGVLEIPARLRLLPAVKRIEALLEALEQGLPSKASSLKARLRPKLFALSLQESRIDEASLQSGRLPAIGKDEVLAGAGVTPGDQITVGSQSLKVVGRLKPDLRLFADCYIIPASETANQLFPAGDPAVLRAALLQLTSEQSGQRSVLEQLEKDFPPEKYTRVMPEDRLDPTSYYRFLAGLAVMLLGGSGALIGLYRWGAGRLQAHSPFAEDRQLESPLEPAPQKAPSRSHAESLSELENRSGLAWALHLVYVGVIFLGSLLVKETLTSLAASLLELRRRARLVWGVHLAYFGLVILGSIWIHEMPEVQTAFLSLVEEALTAKTGVLAPAGQAYRSGIIPFAAFVTFCTNFFLGSLLCITLPSMILPGSGVVMAALRSFAWGVILAPTLTLLAMSMLPHSGTMLLEGEGYILATIFGLLIPFYILEPSLGGTPLSRFRHALLLNLQSCVLVALVLAVAACYEATEVILLNR